MQSPLLVHKSASDRDIKHAYKKLSKKYHPDKNKDPNAENMFIDIAHGTFYVISSYSLILNPPAAYEVLSDDAVSHYPATKCLTSLMAI